MPPKDFNLENSEIFTKGYNVGYEQGHNIGYQEGYLAAQQAAERIILNLQHTIEVLRDTNAELRAELRSRWS